MIIKDFKPFVGLSCEPTMIGNLLKNVGLELSEPMIFGLGEGLGFIYWDSKQMGFPFLGGRCKQDKLTENIQKNLNLKMTIYETTSKKSAWDFVKKNIDNNVAVGLKLDCYYLEYFKEKIHFAAHYVTMYGYDKDYGYLIDTKGTGIKGKSSLLSISEARSAKGPMSSNNKAFIIDSIDNSICMKEIIAKAINNNAKEYLNPPIQNISYKGINKTAKVITEWYQKPSITPKLISQVGFLMEEAGTGGALFRNMYRDFLKECITMYPELNLQGSYESFVKIAPMWTEVAKCICKAGNDNAPEYLEKASIILKEIAILEEEVMKQLFKETSVFLSK